MESLQDHDTCPSRYSTIHITHDLRMSTGHLLLAHVDEVTLQQNLVGLRVVRVRVEHDERKRQHIRPVSCAEAPWVVAAVSLCKLLHDALDLLRLACAGAI